MFNRWSNIGFVVAVSLIIGLQTTAQAESQRGINTKENIFPRRQLWEIGSRLTFSDADVVGAAAGASPNDSVTTVIAEPYFRYGVNSDFSLDVDLPFGYSDSDVGGTDGGLGNLGVGFQLRAYEDVLEQVFIIPHAKINFETADENSGLDDGSGGFEFGVSVGQITADIFHWVGDVSYELRADEDNLLRGSATLVAELSEKYSLIGEGSITDGGQPRGEENPFTVIGGMAYDWSANWQTSVYGGSVINSDNDDVFGMFKASYQF